MRRKKEASKVKQTNKASNTAHSRQSLSLINMSCLGWDSNPRHSTLETERSMYIHVRIYIQCTCGTWAWNYRQYWSRLTLHRRGEDPEPTPPHSLLCWWPIESGCGSPNYTPHTSGSPGSWGLPFWPGLRPRPRRTPCYYHSAAPPCRAGSCSWRA